MECHAKGGRGVKAQCHTFLVIQASLINCFQCFDLDLGGEGGGLSEENRHDFPFLRIV